VSPEDRCAWALGGGPAIGDAYIDYHDNVWGVPERDPRVLFEFLVLEGAQAGLSWSTILRKLDTYRAAYRGFDPEVDASIRNARAWLELDDPVSYLWGFVDGAPIQNTWSAMEALPAETDRSRAMSKDLKRRGFGFVGPTICYAFMQATGMVNDHVTTCFRHAECLALA
jgi:DNA-3-methyladenine glycosylase I